MVAKIPIAKKSVHQHQSLESTAGSYVVVEVDGVTGAPGQAGHAGQVEECVHAGINDCKVLVPKR